MRISEVTGGWIQSSFRMGAGNAKDQGRIRGLDVEPLFILETELPGIREQDGWISQVTDVILGASEMKP